MLDLKRGGRRDGLKVFAGWMARAGGDVLADAYLDAPTPLHWTQLLRDVCRRESWS